MSNLEQYREEQIKNHIKYSRGCLNSLEKKAFKDPNHVLKLLNENVAVLKKLHR